MSKTYKQIVEESISAVLGKEISKSDQAVIGNIESLLNELRGNGLSGKDYKDYTRDELSKIQGSLAILKCSLGEMLAQAKANVSRIDQRIHSRRDNLRQRVAEMTREKIKKVYQRTATVPDIDAELEKQVHPEKEIKIFREHYLEKLQNLWWSLNTMINVMDTRIKMIGSEFASEKFGENALNFDITNPLPKEDKTDDIRNIAEDALSDEEVDEVVQV